MKIQAGEIMKAETREKEKARLAAEWRRFRRDFLFSQTELAAFLKCSLRTVVSVEGGSGLPQARFQRRFRDLKRRCERQEGVA
jgi:hypothetical protein